MSLNTFNALDCFSEKQLDFLRERGAKFVNKTIICGNYPEKDLISFHFFSEVHFVDDRPYLGQEVATFHPDMHSRILGGFSGWVEQDRKNGIDLFNLFRLVYY